MLNICFATVFCIACYKVVFLKKYLLQLSPDWQIDYETYDWKKLDPDSEETKKMLSDYFSWTGTDKAGRPFNQGKIFK